METHRQKTLRKMTEIFCRDHHKGAVPCKDCQLLLDYALGRLAHCTFGENKPACSECPVHCYRANERERTKAMMRYAGPRMALRHPVLSLWHFIDIWLSPRRIARWRSKRAKTRS